jgi:hypothetical protein
MQVTSAVSEAKARFDSAPLGYTAIALFSLGLVAFGYWKYEYQGVAGFYQDPAQLLVDLGEEDNVLLVDIRQDEDLDSSGLLDLKRAARGKAVHLPYCPVRCSTRLSSPLFGMVAMYTWSTRQQGLVSTVCVYSSSTGNVSRQRCWAVP